MKSIVTIVIIILFFLSLKIKSCTTVDSCLDKGGSYNYDVCECDFGKSHKYTEINTCL